MRISDWSSDVCSSDLLPASHLHHARAIFVRCIGNGPQFIGRRDPAPHEWHDRISAVLLDIRVHPFLNETAARLLLMLLRPGAYEIIIHCGGARIATIRTGQGNTMHHLRDRLDLLFNRPEE